MTFEISLILRYEDSQRGIDCELQKYNIYAVMSAKVCYERCYRFNILKKNKSHRIRFLAKIVIFWPQQIFKVWISERVFFGSTWILKIDIYLLAPLHEPKILSRQGFKVSFFLVKRQVNKILLDLLLFTAWKFIHVHGTLNIMKDSRNLKKGIPVIPIPSYPPIYSANPPKHKVLFA